VKARLLGFVALLANNPGWSGRWRVNLAGLQRGGVRIACSVLLWPTAEPCWPNTPPDSAAFDDLKKQLKYVEDDLANKAKSTPLHVVKTRADLTVKCGIGFVHCVERGFHLGPDPGDVDKQVRWLSEEGVAYITLAHLLFRCVATNAPAIPPDVG